MPVTTPSNSPKTQRIPSTRSSAATKCISEVPGLAKHTSTPPPTSVLTKLSAPFISPSPASPQALRRDAPHLAQDAGQGAEGQGGVQLKSNRAFWLKRFA